MHAGTKHVVAMLRTLADEIEHGRAVYFELKTDAGVREGHMLGLTAEQRAFQRIEFNAEINPNAPKRCPECGLGLGPGDKCVTVECPVDAEEPSPFTWHVDEFGAAIHTGCGGVVDTLPTREHRCMKCGATV